MSLENPQPEPGKPIVEKEESQEKAPGFDFDFYITDHSADNADTGSPETLRELYADIKKDGVQSVRYDWRWTHVEPASGTWSEEHLERYKKAKEIMHEVGLEVPTIILSNPPAWAVELYSKDKEKFFDAYRKYAERVRDALMQAEGPKVARVQVLNELNNRLYTPITAEDLPRVLEITRDVFNTYNPEIKLMVSVAASNTTKLVGESIEEYLPKLKAIKDGFDTLAVDYYPGLWHLTIKDIPTIHPKEIFKRMVTDLGALEKVYAEIATWDKDYELGEVGLPTKKLWGGEKAQRYFYNAFFRAYKHLLVDLRSRGVKLPSQVGFYEAMDEPPKNLKGKILRTTPFPEHDMGLRDAKGKRKSALERLSGIMSYLRAPMEAADANQSET